MPRSLFVATLLAIALLPSAGSVLRAQETDKPKEGANETTTFAEIEIKGSYPEGPVLPGLFGELTENLETAIARLDKAAGDDKIDGVILKIHGPTIGWAKMNAFRKAIARVREKGKKV